MNADDWTKTKGEGLTSDTSSIESGSEYRHGQKSGDIRSSITPTAKVVLPTQEEADAVWGKKAVL